IIIGYIDTFHFFESDCFSTGIVRDQSLVVSAVLIIIARPIVFIVKKGVIYTSLIHVNGKSICWIFRRRLNQRLHGKNAAFFYIHRKLVVSQLDDFFFTTLFNDIIVQTVPLSFREIYFPEIGGAFKRSHKKRFAKEILILKLGIIYLGIMGIIYSESSHDGLPVLCGFVHG